MVRAKIVHPEAPSSCKQRTVTQLARIAVAAVTPPPNLA